MSLRPVAPVDITVHLYAYENILKYYSIAAVLTNGGETIGEKRLSGVNGRQTLLG